MEQSLADRFDIDWGHFRCIGLCRHTAQALRLLPGGMPQPQALRRVHLHSQSFGNVLVRCHLHTPSRRWLASLASFGTTTLPRPWLRRTRRQSGSIPSALPRFRSRKRFSSRDACHVAAAWEKGKIERAIGYLRRNFWPLRSFTDLADVNRQVRQWLDEIANRRQHRETGQVARRAFFDCGDPADRCQPSTRIIAIPPRSSSTRDLRLHFDGNRYCVPPRYVGPANSPSKLIHLPSRFTISIMLRS